MLRRSMLIALVAAATVGFTACGDDNKDSSSTPAAPTATTPAAAAGSTLTLAADPGGALAYDKKTLSASPGDVTVEFTNDSQVPHNVVIEQGETEAGSTDTITKSKTSKSFTLDAGEYTFYCSVDNHKNAGMTGTLTVR
jgi:plastocyanin